MNLKKILIGVCLLSMGIGFTSCNDDDDDTSTTTGTSPAPDGITFTQPGSLKVSITHTFGSKPFDLSPASFVTKALDTIRVGQLSYYVSNVMLTATDGHTVKLGGYFLQDFMPGRPNDMEFNNIPAGTYKTISYLIGVDSIANSTGAHTGDLDPSYGMYWPWAGYVFVRLIGRHSAANHSYSFDIGGDQNVMKMSHNLLSYKVQANNITAGLKFDIEKVFNTPEIYDLKTDPNTIHTAHDPGIDKFTTNIKGAVSLTTIY